MFHTEDYFFPVDHPTAPGHFPGNPIIPGALLLSEVIKVIALKLNLDLVPSEIKSAKFFYPTRPGDQVKIEFSSADSGDIKFNCTVEEKKVLAGQIKCRITTNK